jgi:hypothetical protein
MGEEMTDPTDLRRLAEADEALIRRLRTHWPPTTRTDELAAANRLDALRKRVAELEGVVASRRLAKPEYAVTCPYCKSKPGVPCQYMTDRNRGRTTIPHLARKRAALGGSQ